jgi:predicted hydrocarbon binding protein
MNRKSFLGRTLKGGFMTLLMSGRSMGNTPDSGTRAGKTQNDDARKGFTEKWITTLLEEMDSRLDDDVRIRLMEACGRACARRQSIKIARSSQGDLDGFLNTMAGILGKENVIREQSDIVFRYSRCYCPLVSEGPSRLSPTYCQCSRGWILEMFEAVRGKGVDVILEKSIKQGDPFCQFRIKGC